MNSKTLLSVVVALGLGILIGIGAGRGITSDGSRPDTKTPVVDTSLLTELTAQPSSESSDWCVEHNIPESLCTLCNPHLIQGFKDRNDWCAEHGLPESGCRACHPDLVFPQEPKVELREMSEEISIYFPENAIACATDGAVIQFASTETAVRAGIATAVVLAAPSVPVAEAPAEVKFNEEHTTLVTSTVPVTIVRWFVSPGEAVRSGQILAEAYCTEVATWRSEYQAAHAEWEVREIERRRKITLHENSLASAEELQIAEGEARSALATKEGVRGLLTAIGIADESVDLLSGVAAVSGTFTLRAPESGILVERRAPLGGLQDAGAVLGVISDPAHLWIEAQFKERDLSAVRPGQRLDFASDYSVIGRVAAEVIWISQYLDSTTRTGTVRARMLSDDIHLQAGTFGRAILYPDRPARTVLAPRDAVQWEGCCNVVFVQESVGRYRPHKVQVARGEADYYRITDGVQPGEQVVVNGSFLLKTELIKSSIGAGCCGIEPTS